MVWHTSGQTRWAFSSGARLRCAAFSPNGEQVVIGEGGGRITLCDATTGRAQATLLQEDVDALAWSGDGSRLAAGSGISRAVIWDVRAGKMVSECRGHRLPVWGVAFSPDGQRLLTGGMDRTAKIWDVASGRELLTLKGHAADLHAIGFSADGRSVVTASDDQTVKIWETASDAEIMRWLQEENDSARQAH
jgi:WD40 repeat protein